MLASIDCQGEAPPTPVKARLDRGQTAGLIFRCPCGSSHEVWSHEQVARAMYADGFLWTCNHCARLLLVEG